MKLLIVLLLFFSSCAIQGEHYRLHTRIKNWYQLLTPEMEKLYAENNTNALGIQIDEQTDQDFLDKLRQVRIDEAIMSFNGTQTAHFFYNTLHKDLAKFSYEQFMKSLSLEELTQFIARENMNLNSKQKILNNARSYYGFDSFSDQQILDFYRNISFPATTYVLVYDWLAFFARFGLLNPVINGNIEQSMKVFTFLDENAKSTQISKRRISEQQYEQWNLLKERAYFNKLSHQQIVQFLHQYILPEMDEFVRLQTIANIKERYKETNND